MDLYRTLTSCNTASVSQLELTPRALALTSHLIQLNPSHFSVWQFRAHILLYSAQLDPPVQSGGRDGVLRAELRWLDALAHGNMKSYQVWQHRRLVVAALGDPDGELDFVAHNLARDAKNYHTWGYRQWLLAHFGGLDLPLSSEVASSVEGSRGAGCFPQLWNGELDYVDSLLRQDVRNNSAWNHRWFTNFARFGLTGNPTASLSLTHSRVQALQKTIRFEMGYAKASLASVPNNASAWNYLRALHTGVPVALSTPLTDTLAWVKTLISTPKEAEVDPSVDIMGSSPVGALEWCLDSIAERSSPTRAHPQAADPILDLEQAESLVRRLMVVDSVRKRYYAYRLKCIRRSLTNPAPLHHKP